MTATEQCSNETQQWSQLNGDYLGEFSPLGNSIAKSREKDWAFIAITEPLRLSWARDWWSTRTSWWELPLVHKGIHISRSRNFNKSSGLKLPTGCWMTALRKSKLCQNKPYSHACQPATSGDNCRWDTSECWHQTMFATDTRLCILKN